MEPAIWAAIAAGAVVNRDLEPHGLYAGVPARRIRDLDAPRNDEGPGDEPGPSLLLD